MARDQHEEEVRGQNCADPSFHHRRARIVRSRGLAAKAARDPRSGGEGLPQRRDVFRPVAERAGITVEAMLAQAAQRLC
jgi:hypothetical protein